MVRTAQSWAVRFEYHKRFFPRWWDGSKMSRPRRTIQKWILHKEPLKSEDFPKLRREQFVLYLRNVCGIIISIFTGGTVMRMLKTNYKPFIIL